MLAYLLDLEFELELHVCTADAWCPACGEATLLVNTFYIVHDLGTFHIGHDLGTYMQYRTKTHWLALAP